MKKKKRASVRKDTNGQAYVVNESDLFTRGDLEKMAAYSAWLREYTLKTGKKKYRLNQGHRYAKLLMYSNVVRELNLSRIGRSA